MPPPLSINTQGDKVAGNARKDTEKELGKSVISQHNYLQLVVDTRAEEEGSDE